MSKTCALCGFSGDGPTFERHMNEVHAWDRVAGRRQARTPARVIATITGVAWVLQATALASVGLFCSDYQPPEADRCFASVYPPFLLTGLLLGATFLAARRNSLPLTFAFAGATVTGSVLHWMTAGV